MGRDLADSRTAAASIRDCSRTPTCAGEKKKPACCGLRFNVLPMLVSLLQPMLSAWCGTLDAHAICVVPPSCKSTNVSRITIPLCWSRRHYTYRTAGCYGMSLKFSETFTRTSSTEHSVTRLKKARMAGSGFAGWRASRARIRCLAAQFAADQNKLGCAGAASPVAVSWRHICSFCSKVNVMCAGELDGRTTVR